MRFLADENFKRRAIQWLRTAGHDVQAVPKGLPDKRVAELAKSEGRILLTHDRDFADSGKFPPARLPGIVFFSLHPPTLDQVTMALANVLSKVSPDSFAGKLIVVSGADSFKSLPPAA